MKVKLFIRYITILALAVLAEYSPSWAQNAPISQVFKALRASAFNPVSPTDYPDNMSMVIMLTSGGEIVSDAEIGAFIAGECRGTAIADGDLYFLLIAGDGGGQPMELRIARDGVITVATTDLTYTSDGNIGTPWSPFVIDLDSTMQGDVNGDKNVDVADISCVIDVMAGDSAIQSSAADVNNDGKVDVADISFIIDIMANQTRAVSMQEEEGAM